MNWKNRLTNYNFWISMFSAVLLILQALKIEFDIVYINEIFTAVLGLLVVIGIISDPTRTSVKTSETTKTQDNEKVPTSETNENHNDTDENDFKAVLNKISEDLIEKTEFLNQKIDNLKNFNQELKNEEISQTPAAAEMSNPYIDTIN